VDGCGWMWTGVVLWMDVDGCGWMWMDVDGCGVVDGCGRVWMDVDRTPPSIFTLCASPVNSYGCRPRVFTP